MIAAATRLPGWEAALADYLERHRTATFAWGQCDCVMFAAGAVEAMTGADLAPARGHYRTAKGAHRMLRRMGFIDVETLIDDHFPAVAPAFAQRGDLVMAEESIGVCAGREAWFVSDEGLTARPLGAWTQAWRVPHG